MITNWRGRALCRSEGHPSDWDDELDIPDDEPKETRRDRRARHTRAKEVCMRCPVKLDCALDCDVHTEVGIWFGQNLGELRVAMERARRRDHLNQGEWSA